MMQMFSSAVFNKKGFTLIEVLIAIVLLALMMIGVYQIVDDSTQTKDMVLGEDREILQVERAFARLELDFENIYTPLFYQTIKKETSSEETDSSAVPFEPSDRFIALAANNVPIPKLDNPEKHSLIFMTTANRRKIENVKQSNFAWVRYTLQNDTRENASKEAPYELVRYFDPNNPYAPEHNWDNIRPQVLLRGIKELEFMFWNKQREDYSSSLKELDEQNVIRHLKIKLTWLDKNNHELQLERVFKSSWPYFDASQDLKTTSSEEQDQGTGGGDDDE